MIVSKTQNLEYPRVCTFDISNLNLIPFMDISHWYTLCKNNVHPRFSAHIQVFPWQRAILKWRKGLECQAYQAQVPGTFGRS